MVLAGVLPVARAQESQQIELLKTDSRAPYVHRLTLYDENGRAIRPTDPQPAPYSPKATCGKCHPVAQIARGWHFNACDPNVPGGRAGEPWLLVDEPTGSLLPLSGRGWPRTFTPEQLAVSPWQFVMRFGGHTPGGGFGDLGEERARTAREADRWRISGALEIDCMFCHSADQQHDPAEAIRQIEAQNLKWAPTVALGLAVVRGEARKAPDDWDPDLPPNPDYPEQAGPKLIYDRRRFDPDDRTLFNITRRPPVERCYFCHSFRDVARQPPAALVVVQDVHLAGGLLCVDCHRHDVSHDIVRGYAREAAERQEPWRAAFSCEGCHMGAPLHGDIEVALGGHHGAPRPEHRGLPPLHFEKLTCTACHSGPWPTQTAQPQQTALAHRLGWAMRERPADMPPEIVAPVFVREDDGRIAPHRLVQPAFWGQVLGDKVQPVPLETLRRAANKLRPRGDDGAAWVQELTAALAAGPGVSDEIIYAAARQFATAELGPYSWPLAHDVRPASQSLGARGCTDCHASGGAVLAGEVQLKVLAADGQAGWPMWRFHGYDPKLAVLWNRGFRLREAFKWLGLVGAGLVALVLLRFALDGVVGRAYAPASPLRIVANDGAPLTPRGLTRWEHVFHTLAGLGLLIQAVTGLVPWLLGGEVRGWVLLAHMAGAPLFLVGLTGVALQWAARCRFSGRGGPFAPGLNVAQRQVFWITLVPGLAVVLTMLLAMLPVAGTEWQETLVEVHSYSALVLLVMMLPHLAVSLAARRARGKTK